MGLAGAGLSRALEPWRREGAVHDPGKIVCDLALSLALGGSCVSDLALLRGQAEVFGPVASVPTVSRLVGDLAKDVAAVERAVARVWKLAGEHAPAAGASAARPRVIDIDATLVNVHSDKEGAAPTFKRGYGLHPLTAWLPHAQALRSIAHDGGCHDVTVVRIGQTDGWFQRLPAGH